eukprot:3971744-Prymnesium_polylepis.1
MGCRPRPLRYSPMRLGEPSAMGRSGIGCVFGLLTYARWPSQKLKMTLSAPVEEDRAMLYPGCTLRG